MGGGGKYPYPKYVYSPLGGWWYEGRPNAHKNVGFKLVVLGGVLLAGGIAIFNFSANYEVTPLVLVIYLEYFLFKFWFFIFI